MSEGPLGLTLHECRAEDATEWDALVTGSLSGTFLHTRRFLGYHGNRFEDTSLCFRERGKLVGVFPAAQDPTAAGTIVSHPGLTYGGIVHAGRLRGAEAVAAVEAICGHFANRGFRLLRYKAVPRIYHRAPAEDDLYALFRFGARRYRCDLSTAIDLENRLPVGSRRKRGLKKAHKSGIVICDEPWAAAELWQVLEANLKRKHGVAPTHNLQEITRLQELFPNDIRIITARAGADLLAGVVLFITPNTAHAQYIASSEQGQDMSALDLVFEYCIEGAAKKRVRFFNFGVSTEQEGRVLNEGLYGFKAEFGGAGVIHEFYEVDLLQPHSRIDPL